MRIGLLGVTDGLEQADGPGSRAHRLVEAAGHAPVALTLEEHDLHRVGAVWLPQDPGPGWRSGAAQLGDADDPTTIDPWPPFGEEQTAVTGYV